MRKVQSCLVVLVVLATLVGMAGCSKQPKADPAKKEPAVAAAAETAGAPTEVDRTGWPVIVAFGDSLTFGQGVTAERSYPSQLQAELDRLGLKYRVVNAGISGDTTTGGAARVDTVIRHKPQIVIVELGANDGLRGQSIDRMKENLSAIIERLQAEQIKVILAGMQIPPNYGPEYTDSFRQAFVDLAARHKLPMIPFFLDGVAARPDLNQTDGIHPTADGYQYVVRNVMTVLQPMLQK